MARFQDIPPFIRMANYCVNVGLSYLPAHVAQLVSDWGLDLSPDFQRGHVWTEQQKIRFVEYMLRGGLSGMDIYTNCPSWHIGHLDAEDPDAWFVLVDGKQRLDAALSFLNNEFPIFGGNYFRDYTDSPNIVRCSFRWHVNDLRTREEVLQWYLDLNSGGVVHTESELDKVRTLLAEKAPYVRPSKRELEATARFDRQLFKDYFERAAAEKARAAAEAEKREALAALAPKGSQRRKKK